jgi:hypothetical protein
MIEILPTENDDPDCIALVQRIVNGAVAILEVPEVYLVHIDNWFDHKWLGWKSSWKHRDLQKMYVPAFNPNRVLSQKHFIYNVDSSQWALTGEGKRLHIRQASRRSLFQKLDQVSKSAAFIWYSGNTLTNGVGSLMLYQSGPENYAWYASFRKGEDWTIADGFRISPREVLSFEERGRQFVSVKGIGE